MLGSVHVRDRASANRALYTNVANAAFLTAFYVPLVPLIAALFLRRHIPLNIWPAVIVSLLEAIFCLEPPISLPNLEIY